MISKRIPATILVLASIIVFAPSLAFAQTSMALSGYGAFGGATNSNGTEQSPANQAGGIFELRHISNPILGFEATYSFNRANQTYTTNPADEGCPAFGCTINTESVSSNAHEITGDWVPSIHFANVRPFAVLGVGLLLDVPSSSPATVYSISPCGATTCPGTPGIVTTFSSPTSTSTKPVYVYGAGLDWGLLPHIGLRLQYRGNLYSAPNVTKLFSSTDTFSHTAEPMVGIYFRL
jgi:opacity protein-like surface antigen